MKETIILGAIGKNPRKNRDGFRVLGRGGAERNTSISHSYRATISFEKI